MSNRFIVLVGFCFASPDAGTAAFGAIAGVTLLSTLLYKAGLQTAGYISYGDFQSVNGMVLFSAGVQQSGKPLGAFAVSFAGIIKKRS